MLWVLASLVCGSVLGQVPFRPVEEEYKLYTFEERAARVRVKKPGIYGGTVTTAAPDYKWMCSLRIADDGCGSGISGPHFCGGSIIDTTTDDKRWVLTAAHCFNENPKTPKQTVIDNYNNANPTCDFRLTVDVGRNDPGDSSCCYWPWTTLRMFGWQMHEGWSPSDGSFLHDIAIAFTRNSLGGVTPLVLKAQCGNCASNPEMRLVGYGAGNPLETVILYYVTWAVCDSAINAHTGGTWQRPAGTICTYRDTTHGFSGGDSGGPLVQTSSGKQVGIVSFYFIDKTIPQVYTSVPAHDDWIEDTIAAHDDTYYGCHNNCLYPEGWYNDHDYCDCPECEDETSWTCTSCGGCPTVCGGDVRC